MNAMIFKSIVEAKALKGKKILLRVDYNVPIKAGRVLDNVRLVASLPTIRLLQQRGVKQIVLLAHLGRPEGRVIKSLSLLPVAQELSKLLRQKIPLITMEKLADGGYINEPIVLLENIRFYKGEASNNSSFIKRLVNLGEVYVNDAFSVSHHPCASITGVPRYLPAYGGLSLVAEVSSLDRFGHDIKKPAVVIVGGAKIADKLPVIRELARKADYILTGGVVATTFLVASGVKVGRSLYDKTEVAAAKRIMKQYGKKIFLPEDVVVDVVGTKKKETLAIKPSLVKNNYCILDLGPATVRHYASFIKTARTILWVGTLGMTEEPLYAHASRSLGHLVSGKARRSAFVVVGGGDTTGFFDKYKFRVDHMSLAGGATLEFLAGVKLPGLKVLGFN